MHIYWYGHACFLVVTAAGTRLLTDPPDISVGYSLPGEPVDGVTVSHHHYDHDAVQQVKGHPLVVDRPGREQVREVNIQGVPSFHDTAGGKERGSNIIFVLEADGLRVAHLGDLGHQLSSAQVSAIAAVDVVMVPVGGTFTVDAAGAAQVVEALTPRVILPMHYLTPQLQGLPLSPVDEFTSRFPEVRRAAYLEIDRESLPRQQEVVVLDVHQE